MAPGRDRKRFMESRVGLAVLSENLFPELILHKGAVYPGSFKSPRYSCSGIGDVRFGSPYGELSFGGMPWAS